MLREPGKKYPWSELGTRARLRLAIGGGAVFVALATFATCGACGKHLPNGGDPAAPLVAADAAASEALHEVDAAALRDPILWGRAKDGDAEDLAALAVHEGALGLVEGASDPALRPTALRAMGYARGWAQLPLLAKVAGSKSDDEANLALEATVELSTRPRRAEDPEDADELREGCETLGDLARDGKRARARRVLAIRALRMMPCPPLDGGALPGDVDTK